MKPDKESTLKNLLEKSGYEIPDKDFENRVMQKIEFAHQAKIHRKRNLRLSWTFLLISVILLPMIIFFLSDSPIAQAFNQLGINVSRSGNILLPAALLISGIIILLQLDNLYKLSFKARY